MPNLPTKVYPDELRRVKSHVGEARRLLRRLMGRHGADLGSKVIMARMFTELRDLDEFADKHLNLELFSEAQRAK